MPPQIPPQTPPQTHPTSDGILESSLYVTDLARSSQFYEKIFGFRIIGDFNERGCALEAGHRQVLLLFKKGGSRDMPTPHDGERATRRRRTVEQAHERIERRIVGGQRARVEHGTEADSERLDEHAALRRAHEQQRERRRHAARADRWRYAKTCCRDALRQRGTL